MDSSLNKLVKKLKPLVNSKINKMVFLIWPDENGISETDIRIHYTFEISPKKNKSYTFGIKTDGQMPTIEKEKIVEDYNYSELSERINKWQDSSFWNISGMVDFEKFIVDAESKYGNIVGSSVDKIEILYFNDETVDPTGLCFSFSSGDNIYCLPGMTKSTILDYFPEDWFPEPVYRLDVSDT